MHFMYHMDVRISDFVMETDVCSALTQTRKFTCSVFVSVMACAIGLDTALLYMYVC